MNFASNGIIPPPEWYHKPELKNNNSMTVSILLALNKVIPPSSDKNSDKTPIKNKW